MEKGIPTPVPVAYLERKGYFLAKYSYYLTLMEQGSEEIRHLFRSPQGRALERLLRALARHIFFCQGQGILHHDLSDRNILVKESGEEEYTFSLIDTNRIRIEKRLGLFRRIKNLIWLGIPLLYQPFFLRQYTATECKRTYTDHTRLKRKLFSRSKK